MVKVYIDWNVMSGMKSNRYPELNSIVKDNKNLLLLYSTSHIGDIYASYSENEDQKKIIEEDLDFISSLTNNLCAFIFKDKLIFDYHSPNELLEERIESSQLFKDFSIDSLFESCEGDGEISKLVTPFKDLLSSFSLEDGFKEAFNNPESTETMNKMFPGLKDDMTMSGFFKAFGKMYNNLNNTEDYKYLRDTVQKIGVNSGHFNEGKNPFDIIDSAYQKFGINDFNSSQYFVNNKNAPLWFNEITNEYLKLDMHGYKADKIKVTQKKKQTFSNTTEDSSHSAFASRCEFYITHDDRNYKKTKAVFKQLEIGTYVFKPDEFINFYKWNLDYEGFDQHFNNIVEIIKKGEGFHKIEYKDKEDFILVHYSEKFMFNFFNKVMLPQGNDDSDTLFILSKDHPAKTFYTVQNELDGMIKILVDKLGVDDNGNSYYQFDEIKNEEWVGRIWSLNGSIVKLTRLNGWFQLYYFLDD